MRVAIIGSRGITSIDLSQFVPLCCTLIIKPDYDRYGRSAPIRRNDVIVDNADLVLAFWDGKSRGTKYTIGYAKNTGKPVYVFEYIKP